MIIYKATNLVNNKVYIGQTKNTLEKRIIKHIEATKYKKNKTYFSSAIIKYGINNFKWSIIDCCYTQEEADVVETYWIDFYKSRDRSIGYNLALGGRVNTGYKWTAEQKAKLSEKMKKVLKESPHISVKAKEGRDKYFMENPNARKELGELHSRRCKSGEIKVWNKGIPMTEDQKNKISITMTGKMAKEKNPFFGKIPKSAKKIICVETGMIFDSIQKAANFLNIGLGKMRYSLSNNKSINNQTFLFKND